MKSTLRLSQHNFDDEQIATKSEIDLENFHWVTKGKPGEESPDFERRREKRKDES